MENNNQMLPVMQGIIIEEEEDISLRDLCRMCRVHADYVLDLIDEGILDPLERTGNNYRFHGKCVVRAQKAMRLQEDMGINLPGIAMILDLLDEIETLKQRLSRFESRQGERNEF